MKLSRTTCCRHDQLSLSIRSETLSSVVGDGCSSGIMEMVHGIHLSVHIEVDVPSPILFIKPAWRASLPAITARQILEADLGNVASMKSTSEKYRPFSTLEHNVSGCVSSLHPCLPNIAWLKSAKSLKPMPPRDFGVKSHSQERQCIFFLPSSRPHH